MRSSAELMAGGSLADVMRMTRALTLRRAIEVQPSCACIKRVCCSLPTL